LNNLLGLVKGGLTDIHFGSVLIFEQMKIGFMKIVFVRRIFEPTLRKPG